jgi:hypothetical protein
MGYPSYPAPQPSKPPFAAADVAISVTLLVLTVVVGVVGAAMGLFMLAFLDSCPPQSCSVDGAVTAVGTALLVALAIGIAGLVVTAIQLFRRKTGWPFAVGTLVLCVLTLFLGGVGYFIAVGG